MFGRWFTQTLIGSGTVTCEAQERPTETLSAEVKYLHLLPYTLHTRYRASRYHLVSIADDGASQRVERTTAIEPGFRS